jgi:oligopeptide transport system permease protein
MTDLAIPSGPPRARSLWADARRRLFRNKAAMLSLILLAIITLACILAPVLAPHPMDEVNWDRIMAPPDWSLGYYFGTDENGRDLLARALYGGRVSLSIGAVATLVSLVIGVAWGAVAGFVGGRIDAVMMRIVDILYALPFVFFVILLTVVFGRDVILMYIAIGAVSWLDMARIVRGQTLSIKRKEFIEAAHASGVSSARIIFKHIIPNCIGPVAVYVTMTVPSVILVESFISYLGMGVQEPNSSWGTLVGDGKDVMEQLPVAVLGPGGVLAVTLLCLNFIGDGLRDALDPKDR